MSHTAHDLTDHLLVRLGQVLSALGQEPPADGAVAITDLLDSMALVEYLAILAEDCGVEPAAIEQAVRRRFGTVAELAEAMHAAGMNPSASLADRAAPISSVSRQSFGVDAVQSLTPGGSWLAATAVRLPDLVQTAETINQHLQRPAGWLESHAGIESRRLWFNQDPLASAAAAGRDCLAQVELMPANVGALLVTSEAPPQLTGLAATLHHLLALRPDAVALEVGGACTGFLAALWLARMMLPRTGPVLVLAVEAPSLYLQLQPGSAGEATALFGDGAAAALVGSRPLGSEAVPLDDVILGTAGSAGRFLQVERAPAGSLALHMDGRALASRAVRTMAQAVRRLTERHGLRLSQLKGIVAHGGNGRLPALLARQLGLARDLVWSVTASTGNLGSASLPVAWQRQLPGQAGPVIWTTVGAGLTWAAALTGLHWNEERAR